MLNDELKFYEEMFLLSSINIRTVVYFLFPTHLNTTINPSRNFHALQIVCVVWAETSLCWLLCVCVRVCNFTCSHQSFSCHCRCGLNFNCNTPPFVATLATQHVVEEELFETHF